MRQDYAFNFKNDGSHSYLTVTPQVSVRPVQYQVKMLENNRIPHLLPLSVAERNGKEELFYEISSCVSLEQLLSRRKMKKREFLSLLGALLGACRELPEYQLPVDGLLLDTPYVFVRTGNFDVRFVYLPAGCEGDVIELVREFLAGLVMRSSIEVSADQFVPSLLELLNDPELNLDRLEQFFREQMQTGSRRDTAPQPQREAPKTAHTSHPVDERETARNGQKPHAERRPPNNFDPEMFRQKMAEPAAKTPHHTVHTASVQQKSSEQVSSAPGQKKKNGSSVQRLVFIILQGVLVVVIGLLLQSGALANEDGSFSAMNLIGILIAAGGIDFLLYRRLFSKQEEQAKGNAEPSEPMKKRPMAVPPQGAQRPAMPQAPMGAAKEMPHEEAARVRQPASPAQPDPLRQSRQAERPAVPPMTAADMPNALHEYEDEYDDTVVMTENEVREPRLTYYENGLVHRVRFHKGSLLVGKQRSQVDLALPSPRVSHVHAEFRQMDGGVVVIDCNSKNGTYINGSKERLTSNIPYTLHNGDVIRVADTELTFEC